MKLIKEEMVIIHFYWC